MLIKSIKVNCQGHIYCKSRFYSSHNTLDGSQKYDFATGINIINGDIDSDAWAISYLMSMYQKKSKDFVLTTMPEITINNVQSSIDALLEASCYMDTVYSLFSTKKNVHSMVEKGIDKFKLNYCVDEIRDLFRIDPIRFERPLSGVGNEVFRCMAAIGYCFGKQVFCFPWISQKRLEYYHDNLTNLFKTLENLDKLVVLPLWNNE